MLSKLQSDLLTAMKAKETNRVMAIRSVIAELQTVESTTGKATTEQNAITAIKKHIKQNEESMAAFAGAGRVDTVTELKEKIAVLQAYLPSYLSKEAIRDILAVPDNMLKIREAKNDGAAVGVAMKILVGQSVEGSTVKEVTAEIRQ